MAYFVGKKYILIATAIILALSFAVARGDTATTTDEAVGVSDTSDISTTSPTMVPDDASSTIDFDTATSTVDIVSTTGDAASSSPDVASPIVTTSETTTPPTDIDTPASSDDTNTGSDATTTPQTGDIATSTEASEQQLDNLSGDTASTTVDSTLSATSSPGTVDLPLSVASSSPDTSLTCDTSYTDNLYDTPSGHLDTGYYLEGSASPSMDFSTTTEETATITALVPAHIIGTQSWTICHDADGTKYEFKLTPEQYSDLALPGAELPQESLQETNTATSTLE